ncbi:MAG TPA: Uma2 family endonuclease [Acetobacteraceae bacterium]|nr:Uma2 family endonuclease [Acetobacteraceae bacterium]
MTVTEFLAWEARQELRYEFDGFQPVAMTGGTIAHDRITFNLHKALDARLAGKPCKSYGPNIKVTTPGKVRYPDALVTCTPTDPNAIIADDPVVVFEVASEDTARTDRIVKLREYQATATIQRYVILEQKSIGASVFTRRGNDWIATALTEGDTLHMPEIDVEVPIDEVYAGLDYSSPAEAEPRA